PAGLYASLTAGDRDTATHRIHRNANVVSRSEQASVVEESPSRWCMSARLKGQATLQGLWAWRRRNSVDGDACHTPSRLWPHDIRLPPASDPPLANPSGWTCGLHLLPANSRTPRSRTGGNVDQERRTGPAAPGVAEGATDQGVLLAIDDVFLL